MIKHNISGFITELNEPSTMEGETIETKIERILTSGEPITDGAPIIYMERKDGINPDYDVRTDRWDAAIDAMDVVAKSKIAKREEKLKKSDVNAESTQGTEPPKPAA